MRRRERTGWGPRRLKGVVGDGGAGAPSLLYDVPPLNLPPGSFSEGAAIKGVNRCRIREIIASLNRQVRWGKLHRVVINGMPWYIPVEREGQ